MATDGLCYRSKCQPGDSASALGMTIEFGSKMRPKSYWEMTSAVSDPFDLPKRISKGLAESSARHGDSRPADPVVKYIWLYVTDDGLVKDSYTAPGKPCQNLDDWLNIVDEASSLGAEWMVVYVGASVSQNPDVWKICYWAQDVHQLKVGIHVASSCMNEEDVEHLNMLVPQQTFIVADKADLGVFRFLTSRGFSLIETNIRPEDRPETCENPEAITCVGANGRLYSCGLVLGDEQYALGDSKVRALSDIMRDESLPHSIPDMSTRPSHGCDACPPLMVKRLEESRRAAVDS